MAQHDLMNWIPLDPYRDENPFGPDAPVKKPGKPKEK